MPRLFAAFLFLTLAYVTDAGDGAAWSAEQAKRFAAEIANAHCKWKFGCRPFDAASAEPTLKNGRWHWRAVAGHGYSDFVTEVTFSQTGESPTVRLDLIHSRERPLFLKSM
jgi:hypothetical protein